MGNGEFLHRIIRLDRDAVLLWMVRYNCTCALNIAVTVVQDSPAASGRNWDCSRVRRILSTRKNVSIFISKEGNKTRLTLIGEKEENHQTTCWKSASTTAQFGKIFRTDRTPQNFQPRFPHFPLGRTAHLFFRPEDDPVLDQHLTVTRWFSSQ